VAEKGGQ